MIKKNLTKINKEIRDAESKYNQGPNSVILIAVSKTQDTSKIQEAISFGQKHFGESYLQEALVKIHAINNPDIIWHYIGKIQSKKAKLIAQNFAWVDTVCSYEIAELLNKYRPDDLPKLNVCIQVNISNQATKNGILLPDLLPLAQKINDLPRLHLCGIMAIPEPLEKFTEQFKVFNELSSAFKDLQGHGIAVDTLNIGMSEDFVAAIAAGANFIRIGTAIFGSRES